MRSRTDQVDLSSGATLIERLSRDDIRAMTSASAFAKGERYQRQGHVIDLKRADGGTRIEAHVRGSRQRPYSQKIELDLDRDGELDIAGACSCPMGFNCKHVAAALLELIDRTPKNESGFDETHILGQGPSPAGAAPASREPERPPARALDSELAAWIDSLVRIEKTESEAYPPDIHQRLLYVLSTERSSAGVPRLLAQPVSVRLRKDNSFSEHTARFDVSSIAQRNTAKFLRPSDRQILRRLYHMPRSFEMHSVMPVTDEEGIAALEAMIATGRARWGSVNGTIVSLGTPRHGRIAWQLADDGSHRPSIQIDGGGAIKSVRLASPWYIDETTGVMGPLETDYAPRVAAGILSAPAVPPGQIKALREAMSRRLPALAALEPPDIELSEIIAEPPISVLRFTAGELPRFDYGWSYSSQKPTIERVPLARLSFRYGSVGIGADETHERPTFARNGRIIEIARDLSTERKAFARLKQLGFEKLAMVRPYGLPPEHRNDLMLAPNKDDTGWLDVLYHSVTALRAEGWHIEIDGDFPIRLLRAEGDLSAEIREGSGIDWFELDLGIIIDGERVDLVPAVLSAITSPHFDFNRAVEPAKENRAIYLTLPDGRVLAVPTARLRPILAALRELFLSGVIAAEPKRLGFSAIDAGSLAEFEAATAATGLAWQGGERIRELGRLLRDSGGIARAAIPSSFNAVLRPYQARGVDWLQFLRAAGLGGVLADDMGLGKTVQTLAHLAIEKASGRMDLPALIVVPTSLLANWRQEVQRFAPGIKLLTLHGAERKSRFGEIASHHLVLTTYPLLARDHAALSAQPWYMVVLDEAQTIKNPNAATTRLAGKLVARHRLCLTGTPLENHLGELWSLFAFLAPGFLGDRQSFHRRWRIPIEKKGDNERRRLLARRVRPFLLRRAKSEVAPDLPPKTEIVEPIEMETGQRDLYESIRLAMHAKVRGAIAAMGLARSRILVLDALLKLRQACCDPRLLKLGTTGAEGARSAKLDRLIEMLPELVEEGRRILLFSQFTSMLALIEAALHDLQLPYVLLTGDTRDRETPIRRFQAGEAPLFLISLKAGGLGLNLTAADTVIHYDPWWNPAVEDQATDRAHRIGQNKPIFVHKLMMLASIEEKMEALKSRKRELAASLFDPEVGTALDLTEADVEALLGPS
jgi:superfamily II DNA or RNA helicase